MRTVKRTRRFNGKVFTLHDWHISKFTANIAADTLRQRGYNVHVTRRPKSKLKERYPLMDLWYVWKRKKQSHP